MRRRIARALAGLLAVLAAVPAGAQPGGVPWRAGEEAWLQGRYGEARTALRQQWRAGQKRWQVAYYLGLSYCFDRQHADGRVWLEHILPFHAVPRSAVPAVQRARGDCPSMPPAPVVQPRYSVRSSERVVSAELLYVGSNQALRFTPLEGRGPAVPVAPVMAGDAAALDREVRRITAALRGAVAPGDPCTADGQIRFNRHGRFLFVSRATSAPQSLLDVWGAELTRYLEEVETRLGLAPSRRLITIHLARCAADARLIAEGLHGVAFDDRLFAGYSVGDDMSVVARWGGYLPDPRVKDSELMRTLRHELAHLTLRDAYGDAPGWLDEGLAQYLGVTADGPAPGRTTVLASGWVGQAGAWAALPELTAVVAPQAGAAAESCVTAAQRMMEADVARMFVAHVDAEPGRLGRLVQALRDRSPEARPYATDAAVIAQVMGRPFAEVEAEFAEAARPLVSVDDGQFTLSSGESCT